MDRILLLCFIHGFKGNDNTFHTFPNDLKNIVSQRLSAHHVESAVYPQYETKGELRQATTAFLDWLKERVIDIQSAHLDQAWPPTDRMVGLVLVAHSMGGFVAAEALFRAIQEMAEQESEDRRMFPLIQGVLTFDTPFNGLARSMFVYGAFSNYDKVSSVFNAMTALSAVAPAALTRLGTRRAAAAAAGSPGPANPAWRAWQLIAVRTGTMGAIAAGGVAAYKHRESIMKGVRNVKNLDKDSVVAEYRQRMDSIGQGLAYINRENVGKSFAWLSDHFTFVGALMKPAELGRRLDRLAALKGVGVQNLYISLGPNGYWAGGYFVPERTFCAIPEDDRSASKLFSRLVFQAAEDEVSAHMNLFAPDKNREYDQMTEKAACLIEEWFLDESDIFDDPKFRDPPSQEEVAEETTVKSVLEGDQDSDAEPATESQTSQEASGNTDIIIPNESPIDIVAAASLVPVPDEGAAGEIGSDETGEFADGELGGDGPRVGEGDEKKYMQHLFGIAQLAGTGVRGLMPTNVANMPAMPSIPTFKQISIPRFFSKQPDTTQQEIEQDEEGEKERHS